MNFKNPKKPKYLSPYNKKQNKNKNGDPSGLKLASLRFRLRRFMARRVLVQY